MGVFGDVAAIVVGVDGGGAVFGVVVVDVICVVVVVGVCASIVAVVVRGGVGGCAGVGVFEGVIVDICSMNVQQLLLMGLPVVSFHFMAKM